VTGVYVENTQSVVQGQVLVDLDPKDYAVAVAQVRADLAQAEAALHAESPTVPITQTTEQTRVASATLDVSSAEAEVSAAQRNYDAALADVKQSEANEANAAADEARYRTLVEQQEVSREAYDQRLTAMRSLQDVVSARKASAEAARRSVQQRMNALEQARKRASEAQANSPRRVAAQRESVTSRQAAVEAASARLQQALLNLSYCKILAPAPGIVGDKTVETGSYVSPGQELFAITQINDLWVTANFKETQIRNMHPGQSVTIHVDALSQNFNGYVENLPGATGAEYSLLPPENATGNFVKVVQRLPVRIRFKPGQPNQQRLRPGMSVEPKVWVK
jgi:membrane fusion protein, multidrug efflux system